MANGPLSGHMASAAANPWSPAQPRATQRPDPCGDDCTPRCPACGGLKCTCRPRFFPGQLLTDRELNGLEQYVVDKNRLHNTYLHGWGVACGLEVVCDDCDPGHVVVRTGYALSPCGDDIVLCADQSVDVCALINACVPRQPNCDYPHDTPPRDCTGGATDWVLAVCYDERPTRGITAMLGAGDSPGGCRCSCGGSGSCGCGGGNGGGGCSSGCNGGNGGSGCSCAGSATKTTPTGRGYKPQCEPTQICEGYRFIAYPVPPKGRVAVPGNTQGSGDLMWAWLFANRSRFGPLIDRVLCCVTKAMELRQSIRESAKLEGAAGIRVYTDYAEALSEFAADFSIHGCTFVPKVGQLRDDARLYARSAPQAAPGFQQDLVSRISVLDNTWMEIVSECLCSALLPGCPTPPSQNCVPLAVVTIDPEDCRIVDICNWSERKILITWPTVTYWLSWLPWRRLTDWILGLCCGTERNVDAYRLLALLFATIFNQEATGTKPATGGIAHLVKEHMAMADVKGPGDALPADAQNKESLADDPLAAAFAADNLLEHMLDEVRRVSTEGPERTGQPEWMSLVARITDGTILSPRPVTGPVVAPDVTELTRRLDDAEAKLKAQDKQIKAQATRIATLAKKG